MTKTEIKGALSVAIWIVILCGIHVLALWLLFGEMDWSRL